MKGTFKVAEDMAKGLIQAQREASVLGRAGTRLGLAAAFVGEIPVLKSGISLLQTVGLRGLGDRLENLTAQFSRVLAKAGTAALEKASPSLERTLATVSENVRAGEVALYGGEEESLLMTRKMAAIVARFPQSEEILKLSGEFKTYLNVQRTIFSGATVIDLGDKIASHTPGTQDYRDFKDYFTTEGGLTTAQANDVVDILQAVPVAVLSRLDSAPRSAGAGRCGRWSRAQSWTAA